MNYQYTGTDEYVESANKRFDESIVHIPPSDCWYWAKGHSVRGYAKFAFHVSIAAHRYAYERWNGPIPKGLCVLHTCHQGHLGCVNPAHLKLGTKTDNAVDRSNGGRQQRGTDVNTNKLTEAQVLEIRGKFDSDDPQTGHVEPWYRDTAIEYGVSTSSIQKIITRVTWKHL